MILEEFSDIRLPELYRVVSNIDLVFTDFVSSFFSLFFLSPLDNVLVCVFRTEKIKILSNVLPSIKIN